MYQPELYKDCWIQTISGRAFPILAPSPSDVDVADIAHSLSNQCRFAGHTREFYSVAQHAVLVSLHVPPAFAWEGLHHDDPEAYCVDLPRPLKHSGLLDGYRDVEDTIWQAVAAHFDIDHVLPPCVKEADVRALLTEQRDLMGRQVKPWEDTAQPYPGTIIPLSPKEAKAAYLERFYYLQEKREFNGYRKVA